MNTLDTILTNTYTIQDLRHRLRILKSHLDIKLFSQAKSQDFSPEDSSWLSTLSTNFINQFTKENFYTAFKDLEKQIQTISPLTIYLSFEPARDQLENIGLWLKNNLTQRLLFEIKIDPTLIGGAALVYKGIYKDYSLKSRIHQQGETILTEFKKYIR